jgi:hypothetical protein
MHEEPHYRSFLYDHETDVHLAYYSAIGRVCVTWSNLEFQLDICTQSMFEFLGGNEFLHMPPRSFDQRVELWKDCFKKLPVLNSHMDKALKFAADLKHASGDRNTLIHTHWDSLMHLEPARRISGTSISPKRGKYFRKNAKIDYEAILKFTSHIGSLNTRMVPFLFFIIQKRNEMQDEKKE